MDKEKEEISIEDLVEKERGNLGTANLTKVTLETFVTWKRKKLQQKADAEKKDKVKLNDFSVVKILFPFFLF